MNRQHKNPYLVSAEKTYQLQPATAVFDEGWLQNFIFTHHQTIPIDEIEPAFGPLIPVCRELPTKAGPVDLLFINSNGLLTLVECKLWKNPEARREVVGQILDYAKELSQWSYTDLETAVRGARNIVQPKLHKLVSDNSEVVDERDFIDSVSRNLRRGRFLLLILGDGIRESVEQITEFMNRHAHLNFGFALVEYGVFRLQAEGDNSFFIQPRVVAQTVEIERAVFRIENSQIVPVAPTKDKVEPTRKLTKVSEEIFYEQLKADSETKAGLEALLEDAKGMGLYIEPGKNSIKVKESRYDINLGVFKTNGDFVNYGIAGSTKDMSQPQIGEEYLVQLAKLFDGGFVVRGDNPDNRFFWTVKIEDRSNGGRYVTIPELLAVQDKWLEIVQKTLDQIAQLG